MLRLNGPKIFLSNCNLVNNYNYETVLALYDNSVRQWEEQLFSQNNQSNFNSSRTNARKNQTFLLLTNTRRMSLVLFQKEFDISRDFAINHVLKYGHIKKTVN